MVSIEGLARVIRGDEGQEINHRLRAKYIKPELLPEVDRARALLREETEKELSVPFGEIWLPDE